MVERELQDSGWFTYWNFPSYELFSSKESILRFSFNILTYKSWRFELLQFLNHSRYTFFLERTNKFSTFTVDLLLAASVPPAAGHPPPSCNSAECPARLPSEQGYLLQVLDHGT
jgi:hypothetical protein